MEDCIIRNWIKTHFRANGKKDTPGVVYRSCAIITRESAMSHREHAVQVHDIHQEAVVAQVGDQDTRFGTCRVGAYGPEEFPEGLSGILAMVAVPTGENRAAHKHPQTNSRPLSWKSSQAPIAGSRSRHVFETSILFPF
ncbi:MAG: hypothetical protein RBS57_12160 [Desulforhabdus sp.]|jgi:hypothetical protein|nr:hypothetical protein [Desulforhabdus sp.]